MSKNKFTGEELTELEDIISRSIVTLIESHKDTYGFEDILNSMQQQKLLKSLHTKIQSMCLKC